MGCGNTMNFGKEKNCETETEILPLVFKNFILQEQDRSRDGKPTERQESPPAPH
jgi:hypothetical protein